MSKPNVYPGPCTLCSATVPAGAGFLAGKVDGRWTVKHDVCPDPASAVAEATPAAKVRFAPTAEQAAAVELFLTGTNLVIDAGAGAAKTSTLVLLAEAAPEKRIQYIAFNKSIVVAARGEFPGNVGCNTAHSLAYRTIVAGNEALSDRIKRGERRVSNSEVVQILDIPRTQHYSFIPEGADEARRFGPAQLASLVLQTIEQFCQTAQERPLPRHFPTQADLTDADNKTLSDFVFPFVTKAWADLTNPAGKLRFTLSHVLKLWQLSNPVISADVILFDEAQDANPVILDVIRKQTCQLVFVGDQQQQIYEWTGAVNAIGQLKARGYKTTTLSQSFRFGPAVAQVANGLLGRLGSDLTLRGFDRLNTVVRFEADPDAILCRTNAAAVGHVLTALSANKRPHLVGGADDIIRFARAALDLQNGKDTDHPELCAFSTWDEVVRHAKEDDGKDLARLVKLIDSFGAAEIIAALRRAAQREADADIIISTAHKSKGRQWNKVKLAADFFAPKNPEDELPAGELRLLYVAVTRAQTVLDITDCPQAATALTAHQLTELYG